MTTFPINTPPVTPATEAIGLKNQSVYSVSPFSGAQVTTTLGYTEWHVTLGFAPCSAAQAKAFMAWLDSLQGVRGSFMYQPHGSGVAITGKTLSAAANATTTTVNVGGWIALQAIALTAGDYVQIGGQFFRITSVPATANGSGVATIAIEPPVRTTIPISTSVNFASPSLELRVVANDETPMLSRDVDFRYLPTLNCVEAR